MRRRERKTTMSWERVVGGGGEDIDNKNYGL
jgi:hypothetical protein